MKNNGKLIFSELTDARIHNIYKRAHPTQRVAGPGHRVAGGPRGDHDHYPADFKRDGLSVR